MRVLSLIHLKDLHKEARVIASRALIQRFRDKGEHAVLTTDGTWILHYDPEIKPCADLGGGRGVRTPPPLEFAKFNTSILLEMKKLQM